FGVKLERLGIEDEEGILLTETDGSEFAVSINCERLPVAQARVGMRGSQLAGRNRKFPELCWAGVVERVTAKENTVRELLVFALLQSHRVDAVVGGKVAGGVYTGGVACVSGLGKIEVVVK